MNVIDAFCQKRNHITRKVLKMMAVLLKFKPRLPRKLQWLAYEFGLSKSPGKIPQSRISVNSNSFVDCTLDRLARTFCDMEEFEIWLDRAADGAKSHQTEMEKQAMGKIVKLQSFAAFFEPEKGDVPF